MDRFDEKELQRFSEIFMWNLLNVRWIARYLNDVSYWQFLHIFYDVDEWLKFICWPCRQRLLPPLLHCLCTLLMRNICIFSLSFVSVVFLILLLSLDTFIHSAFNETESDISVCKFIAFIDKIQIYNCISSKVPFIYPIASFQLFSSHFRFHFISCWICAIFNHGTQHYGTGITNRTKKEEISFATKNENLFKLQYRDLIIIMSIECTQPCEQWEFHRLLFNTHIILLAKIFLSPCVSKCFICIIFWI